MNQRTLAQLGQLGDGAQPGEELLFQLFYREEDSILAREQDALYGGILGLKTFGHGMKPWPVWALREGVLRHLPP